MWDPIGLKTLGDFTLQVYTNLKKFLGSDDRLIAYKYRVTNTKLLKVLLENLLYTEYTDAVIRILQDKEKHICKTLMISTLPSAVWARMRTRLLKVVRTIKPGETFLLNATYELDEAYELTIEINTCIQS